MADCTLKNEIAAAQKKAAASTAYLSELLLRCTHANVQSKYDAVFCDDCGRDLGWFCGKSPTRTCAPQHGTCVYCGEPDERY